MEKVKSNSWIVFALVGFLFVGWGFHQFFVIPTYTDHWDWLVPTPDLLEYIKFRFQNLGAFTFANGVFVLGVALTGLRKGERWAWVVLTVIPVYILFLTAIFYWLSFLTIPLALLTSWALWVSRDGLQPVVSNRRRAGWVLVFIVGLLLLYFAYDNLFVIPALDVRDPERGWDWLTTNPEHIDYIKLYFRVYGIHILVFGAMALLSVWFGLREGYRSSWQVLWLVPLLIVLHVFFWPWTAPILIAVALLAAIGLWWARPNSFSIS
ncbi:MAG: hypothetical protein H8E29_15000 [Anaerolineales bacterium]|uniref:Uncharacterized protein n=1 Tax=Candidatus Desulfolinea nitratireducens TaxID=2841698 RepID=A0A8J6TH30_9CHLR|nr:hypothetical protein [Candidatus Desulfolinea nitratireducens]